MPDIAVSSLSDDSDPDLLNCLPVDLMRTPVKPCINRYVFATNLVKSWTPDVKVQKGAEVTGAVLEKGHKVIVKFDCTCEKRIANEYDLLSQVKHLNIVSVFKFYYCDTRPNAPGTQPRFPFFVMEKGECSLAEFLHEDFGKRFSTFDSLSAISGYSIDVLSSKYTMNRCLHWLQQIAEGMDFLHKKDILHRDLKSDNALLFDGCKICKVCDLDFGRRDRGDEVKTEGVGTDPYAAPEVSGSAYSFPVDYYSFGILMAECLTRKKPKSSDPIPTQSTFGESADEVIEFKNLKAHMENLKSADTKSRPSFIPIESALKVCLSKFEAKLPEFELRSNSQLNQPNDEQAQDAEVRRTPSKQRPGLTVFYSVERGKGAARSNVDGIPRKRIAELLKVNSPKINFLAAKHSAILDNKSYKDVVHDFTVSDPTHENQLFRIEHVIFSYEEESEAVVHNYCSESGRHLKWLSGRFQDEPDEFLNDLEFTVQKLKHSMVIRGNIEQ